MLILQNLLTRGTAQCLLCKKENWKSTSPSVLPLAPGVSEPAITLGSSTKKDHQRDPLGQKNACIEGKENMLMILGKLLSYLCLLWKKQYEYLCENTV